MITCLNPAAKIPSADTLRNDLDANFEQMKEKICHILQVSNFFNK